MINDESRIINLNGWKCMRIIKQCGTNEVKPRKRAKEIKNAAKGVQAVGRGCQIASKKR